MASINKTFCEKPRAFIERKGTHQKEATKLLEEYEKRLRRGDNNANPNRYLARYIGPDKEVFRIELNLITLLVEGNKKRSQEWNRLETTDKIQKASGRIMASLTAHEQQTTKTTEEQQRKATQKEKVKKQEG